MAHKSAKQEIIILYITDLPNNIRMHRAEGMRPVQT